MDKQPSSGDLKDIQREHELSQVNNSSSSNPPSLVQRRQSNKAFLHQYQGEMLGEILPMPTGAERMAALRDLGATFEEGNRSIAKVATPTETVVASFVDSKHLEKMLHKKEKSGL